MALRARRSMTEQDTQCSGIRHYWDASGSVENQIDAPLRPANQQTYYWYHDYQ